MSPALRPPPQRPRRRTALPQPAACLTGVALVAMLLAGTASRAGAQPSGPTLVDPATLNARLSQRAFVLLHVGSAEGYASGHIEGARPVSLADLSTPRGEGSLTLELPDVETLRARLAALGVGDGPTIVVYAGTLEGVSQATRVVFTLDYLGLGHRTQLLDGGLPAWRAAGLRVITGAPPDAPAAALPTVQPRSSAVATRADVEAAAARRAPGGRRSVVVDARTHDFYAGTNDRRGAIPRPGHVPGAVNLPFADFYTHAVPTDESSPYVLKPRAELEAMLARAGITRDTTVITYCHIGQQATVPYVVARLLGYDVRLFDGSFEEWSATPSVEVEK